MMMALHNARREELSLGGLNMAGMEEETVAAKFDLTLNLTEGEEGIGGVLEYSQDLYERETIERLARHYEKVLEEMVRDPEQRIREIDLLSSEERRQIIEEWNETERVYAETRSVHRMGSGQAERRPEKMAVKCGQEQISYRELNERADRLAHHLRELGVGPEVMVGVCLERSIEMVVGLRGILKAGGAYVPMDPSYPDWRLKMMIEDAGVRLLLTQEELMERCAEQPVKLICMDRDLAEPAGGRAEESPEEVTPEQAAYVIYTSGSTGRPKGVIVTHGSVRNLFNAVWDRLEVGEEDVWSVFHSYGFDFSVWEMWGALISGGAMVIAPQIVARTAEEFSSLVEEEGVTIMSQTPSAFRQFISCNEERGGREGSLRAVIFGGEALEYEGLKGWMERYGEERPQLINMYGITETTVHTTYKRVRREDVKEGVGSVIGKPLSNMRMYVLDDRMQAAPVGVIGELYVGGEGMARGYVGREELTAERFLPSPYGKAGERVYRTGDLARYLRDGEIEYVGRKDHQVKIRGYRIELGEIEAALRQYEGIREAVVTARGEVEGEERLGAYLGREGEERLKPVGLREYLKQRFPEYMLPAAYITLKALPLTANGKLDRVALPAPADGGRRTEEYVADRTPIEEIVAGILEEVLRLDRVGIYENFFEIGGHSLLATQVASRVRGAFGVEIGVRSVFEEPRAEGLARVIEEAMRAGERDVAPPLVKVPREGRLPLSFAQQRLWFIEPLEPGKAVYNIPGAVRLKGVTDLRALERVINEIVRRHESLRTRFEIEAGEPGQV